MTRRNKHFQQELKKIAVHFSYKISHSQILRHQAIAIDEEKEKMIVLDHRKNHHFKIVNLAKIISSAMKVTFKNIGAGELEHKNMDEFIQKMSLSLDHVNEAKSVEFDFFNADENASNELTHLRLKLNNLKNILAVIARKQLATPA
ncbi:MAG: hypothetical protein JNK79_02640 [Chitinophagaceae bacterium]|nr:hypothetical protein [Chitinophagaceae bacterium]